MSIENYLNKFKENGISIQITLDSGKAPTVHAFDLDRNLHKIVEIYLLKELLLRTWRYWNEHSDYYLELVEDDYKLYDGYVYLG